VSSSSCCAVEFNPQPDGSELRVQSFWWSIGKPPRTYITASRYAGFRAGLARWGSLRSAAGGGRPPTRGPCQATGSLGYSQQRAEGFVHCRRVAEHLRNVRFQDRNVPAFPHGRLGIPFLRSHYDLNLLVQGFRNAI
jgi:hypothetical protein